MKINNSVSPAVCCAQKLVLLKCVNQLIASIETEKEI